MLSQETKEYAYTSIDQVIEARSNPSDPFTHHASFDAVGCCDACIGCIAYIGLIMN